MVAKLKGLGDSEYTVKPEETYAEMWIGTHPSGPSRVVRDGSPGPLLKVCLATAVRLSTERDRTTNREASQKIHSLKLRASVHALLLSQLLTMGRFFLLNKATYVPARYRNVECWSRKLVAERTTAAV